jgi:hypothetical protein
LAIQARERLFFGMVLSGDFSNWADIVLNQRNDTYLADG